VQIVAGSGTLGERASRLTQQVLPWLYAPPAVACGWVEDDGVGIAFRRTPTGLDAAGRTGSFFVHALIWRAGSMPIEILARLWDAGIWQSAPPDAPPAQLAPVQSLEELQLEERVEVGQSVLNATLAGVLENLAAGRGTQLALPVDVALPVAAAVAARLPAKVGLLSFSTAETPERAARYDMVAGQEPIEGFGRVATDPVPGDGWRAAAELLITADGGDPQARELVDALTERAGTAGEFAQVLGVWMLTEAALATPEGVLSPGTARVVAADPRLVGGLAARGGVAGLARSVATGACLELLDATLAAGVPPELSAALGTELALVPVPRALGLLASLAPRLPDAAPTLAVTLGRAWLDGRLDDLRTSEALTLARLVAAAPDDATSRGVREALIGRSDLADAIVGSQLPLRWRADATAVHAATLNRAVLAQALLADRHFAAAFVRSAPLKAPEAMTEAVDAALAGQALDVAEAAAGALDGTDRVRALWPALVRASPHSRVQAMAHWCPRDVVVSDDWVRLAIEAAIEATLEVRDTRRSLPPLHRLFAMRAETQTAGTRAWLVIADALAEAARTGRLLPDNIGQATKAAAALADRREADVALEWVVDACADDVVRRDEVWIDAMLTILPQSRERPEDFVCRVARAASRVGALDRSALPSWTILLIARGLETNTFPGSVTRRSPVAQLDRLLSHRDVVWLDRWIAGSEWGKSASKWLKGSVKAASRHQRR